MPTFHEVLDSPTAHLIRETVEMLSCETDFISPFTFAMAYKQPWSQTGGLCNLGQAAGARLLHTNPWRRPPRWATCARVVKIWPRGWDHQCCSYSLASSSTCVCESRQRTFWTLFMTTYEWPYWVIGDNWTCSPCCHWNLCFWRVIKKSNKNLLKIKLNLR